MRAEVIALGDELTSGERLDTNSQWLSRRLGDLGLAVAYHQSVGDQLENIVAALRVAVQRSDILLCTGGLGPTADDLTREALAALAGVELVQDDAALDHIRSLFARRGRSMPERNLVQAMFPDGARVVPNPHGSAPGIDLEIARDGRSSARIFALPGVPAEMKEMWAETAAPAVVKMLGGERRTIRHHTLKCFGVGESDFEAMLPDLIRRGRRPSVGITVSRATITLRVTADGRTGEECLELMQPTIATIRECLGDLVFGEGDDELQHAVVRLLAARGQSLSTVECGSGGMLADWLSEASPVKEGVYLGGLTVRGGMPKTTFDRLASGDPEAADEVAQECRRGFGADYALALGPFPANESDERALVSCAIADNRGLLHKSVVYGGHPDIRKARAVKQALNFLRLHLMHKDR